MVGKFIIKALGYLLVAALIWSFIIIGNAYEDHVRCLNGYTEVCIPADYK